MFKLLCSFFCLMVMLISTDTRASDKMEFTKYTSSSQIPASFYNLGGASSMANKTYRDDDGKQRSDKVYYTVSQTYLSAYKESDLAHILNPSSGKLGSLFEDTDVKKSNKPDTFDVMMGITTPLKTFICENNLLFKKSKSGPKDIYRYTFTDFNMVFTDIVIQIEVQREGSESRIVVKQIAAVKGSTYDKLKSYLAVGKFEKALKQNLAKLKSGLGGH